MFEAKKKLNRKWKLAIYSFVRNAAMITKLSLFLTCIILKLKYHILQEEQ